MSHITHQFQRDENNAIDNCQFRRVRRMEEQYNDWTGEMEPVEVIVSECGPWTTLSYAQDRCERCRKVVTY
jgi:hypothetical protein